MDVCIQKETRPSQDLKIPNSGLGAEDWLDKHPRQLCWCEDFRSIVIKLEELGDNVSQALQGIDDQCHP